MSANKRTTISVILAIICLLPCAYATSNIQNKISNEELAKELGWVDSTSNMCGGYYLESGFPTSDDLENIHISSQEGFLAMRGTSVLENQVTINKHNQEITANRAFLYRDPISFKLTSTDMIGNVHLREPNTLLIARRGHYNFNTKTKSLQEIIYRTGLIGRNIAGPEVPAALTRTDRQITTMTAWGRAAEFSQTEPRVYNFTQSTYTTCPPLHPTWQLRGSSIELNKNTGRGYAKNARIYIKNIPILYIPYIDFSIDNQRKSGFLVPSVGYKSEKLGNYFLAPFYWNLAPNYDMTLYPSISSKRGFVFGDDFRYLTHIGNGNFNFTLVPHDPAFASFQSDTKEETTKTGKYTTYADKPTQAEYNRLLGDSTTRGSFYWRDTTYFDSHWSSHVDFNYASDDYYLKDYGSNLNETTANYLLQEGDLNYKDEHWNITGRLQGYETLHALGDPPVQNQYRRYPQLIVGADYPDQKFGLEYFFNSEITHFDIRNTPGTDANLPIGNREHIQPGISLPMSTPYFFLNPRLQLALTNYNLYQTNDTNTPTHLQRTLPIVDIASGFALNRETDLFGHAYNQTLEPQVYYTYIPYVDQTKIPIFDTTVNTLTYDQIFNYNRFSGLDRIGDANQIGIGLTTRLIDQMSGLEKVRMGLGEIMYFRDRKVTFCNDTTCTDNPNNANNRYSVSPLSGLLDFHISPYWGLTGNVIWNTVHKQMDNSSLYLHYISDDYHVFNVGFTYARNFDYASGINVNTSVNNQKLTDVSLIWPLGESLSVVGRWTEDWNNHYFQSLIYGLQYDTCCWAVRLGGGKTFTGLVNNQPGHPDYADNYYIQFDLKGLGTIGNGNPNAILSSINGYKNLFGQEN